MGLARVIDLTGNNLPGWLKLTNWMQEDFLHINDSGFETLCQAFGRAARNSMISAILCPSARVERSQSSRFPGPVCAGMRDAPLGEEELKNYSA